MEITKEISIEDLIEMVPASVKYLMEQGIRCIVCGEPIWGTLEEAAKEKGFSDTDIEKFVTELQAIANNTDKQSENKDKIKRINVNKLDTDK